MSCLAFGGSLLKDSGLEPGTLQTGKTPVDHTVTRHETILVYTPPTPNLVPAAFELDQHHESFPYLHVFIDITSILPPAASVTSPGLQEQHDATQSSQSPIFIVLGDGFTHVDESSKVNSISRKRACAFNPTVWCKKGNIARARVHFFPDLRSLVCGCVKKKTRTQTSSKHDDVFQRHLRSIFAACSVTGYLGRRDLREKPDDPLVLCFLYCFLWLVGGNRREPVAGNG